MRLALVAVAALLAFPALAADRKVTLSDEEIAAIVSALDLATKTGGLQAAQVALPLAMKLQEAQRESGAK